MKKCPQCGREYDVSMRFCLDDGAELLYGPAAPVSIGDEPATAILSGVDLPSESPTRAQINTTDQAGIRPSAITDKPKRGLDKRLLAIPFLLAIIGLGGFLGYRYFLSGGRQINSIAVLPFQNKSGDANSEYLSDGLAESLIYRLSQLPNLKVSPTSSVIRYKGKDTEVSKIASELGVDAVMTGRLAQIGDNLTISVELVDVRNNKLLWGEQYERKMSELLATQREITGEIITKLKLKLSGPVEQKLAKKYTDNNEAYQLYLKGNFYRTKYTEEGYRKGIEFYEKAIAIDPNYALAHYGIAAAYDFASGDYLSENEGIPRAKAACLKALELDDTLGEAHFQLGRIAFWYEWDWPAAEKHWRRANELDPAYPAKYPIYLIAMGRDDEAIREQNIMLKREPLDLLASIDLAGILLAAGQIDKSIEQSRKALEIDPNFWWSYQLLGLAYEAKKQHPEAIAAMEKSRQLDVNPSSLGYLGYVYAAAGRTEDARRVLEELRELSKRHYVTPYFFASIHSALNEKDEAFEWLERAYRDRSYRMATLSVKNWGVDNLRSDPRFKAMLKRLNLPE